MTVACCLTYPQVTPDNMNRRHDLTDDNSLSLGIGERIEPGVYAQVEGADGWVEVTPTYALCGMTVESGDPCTYRRLLATANTRYETGAQRTAQEGRGRFDLIPYEAMLALARRLEEGGKLYGDRNWEKGMPLSRYLSSLRRHSAQICYDFSEDHAGAAMFNAAAFISTAAWIKQGKVPASMDDLGYLARMNQTVAIAGGYLNSMPVQPTSK